MSQGACCETHHTTQSIDETLALGERLGLATHPGDIIALRGDLGSGKTVLAKGIARGLGIDPHDVSSPTFVLMVCHEGRIPLYHFDAYRLSDASELLAIGAEETFYGEGVCAIEWAERVEEILPDDRLEVLMEVVGESTRAVHLKATGLRSAALLRAAE